MTQNRFYSSVSPPTTLAAAIASSGATSIQVNSIAGNPSGYPWTLLIDWGLSTQEAVSITQAATGSGPYTFANVTRGIDSTVAQTHSNGAVVVHGVTAEDYNEPQVHISLATSGSAYPNVVHGLANGSSVVGTTDTQTLTNKTLGATTFTGGMTLSESSATGLLVQLTNTHASPSNANVQWTAAGATDNMLGVLVSGDTDYRLQVNSAGKMQWGAGGASAVDTDLYRASAGVLETDTAFTVGTALSAATSSISTGTATGPVVSITNTTGAPTNSNELITSNSSTDKAFGLKVSGDTVNRLSVLASGSINWGPGSGATDTNLYRSASGVLSSDETVTATTGLQVGSATTGFGGGVGVVGLTNAGTPPSSTISGGAVLYAQSGLVKASTAAGLLQVITGSQPAATSPVTVNAAPIGTLGSMSVPANDVAAGATYAFFMSGNFSTASGTNVGVLDIRWGGTAGTVLVAITSGVTTVGGAPALTASMTTVPISISGFVQFTSTTACSSQIQAVVQNSGTYTTPPVTWMNATTSTGLTTTSTKVLSVDWTWSTFNSGDTITINSSSFERIS